MLMVADIGEGVSKITEKLATYFMDGPNVFTVNNLKKLTCSGNSFEY